MSSNEIVYERTIHNILKKKVYKYGDRNFFFFKDLHFSFNDLDKESDKVASGMQSIGAVKGDKIGIVMDNRPEFLFLWFGLCKLGAIEVPINTAHKGDPLIYMIDQADCRFLVVQEAYLERVGSELNKLSKIEKILVLSDKRKSIKSFEKTTIDYRKLTENNGSYDKTEVLWSDPFIILFTSGTTGAPKGALMPHNYAIFMGEICTEACQYTEEDCLYNTFPLFHGNAQLLSTMPALISGAQMVLGERFSASRLWSDVKKYGCTEFNYVGGIIPILLKAEPKKDDSDNPLRVLFGGGCPPHLIEEAEQRFGVTILEGFGMSEIGIPLHNTLKSRKKGSCGKPIFDYSVKLVNDYDLEVEPNTPGELLVRNYKPYTMFLEYYKMPEKTVEAWRDLWFRTGDYLRVDDDGYFYFVDRKKDVLRKRGENISSQNIEKLIMSHPYVYDVATIAVKSDLAEDEILACVVLKSDSNLTPKNLLDFCQERMAYFMVPRYIRFMDSLPKTQTEKVIKSKLREEGITCDTWDREKANYEVKQ